jgi:hypothetical protein
MTETLQMTTRAIAVLGILCLLPHGALADEPPTIPVGLDAYRMWDHWADQRIGQRTYMRSTYDRSGGNADPSNFLFQLSDTSNVSLDVEGSGLVAFMRYNHWHGSPWHYFVDGNEFVLRESMTADPAAKLQHTAFIPDACFFEPFAYTWGTTKGADLIWTPLEFEKTFRMSYERTHYGTGYYIYDLFVPGAKLSHPVHGWDGKSPPDRDVVDLVNRSGSSLLPELGSAEEGAMKLATEKGLVSLPKDGPIPLATMEKGPSMLRAMEFSVPEQDAVAFGRAHLRATWDNRAAPSIDAPVALFFGAGTLYHSGKSEYLVKAFPLSIRFTGGRAILACYFPMPFFKSARIELVGNGETPIADVQWTIRHAPFAEPPNHVGYFHATYRDHGVPEPGKDLILLDTREQEGSSDWSGSFIGTSFIFSDRANLNTLEGDPRFFFDDSQTPQAQGTGTEEWGGGGDYWGGVNMTLPFAGHPVGVRDAKDARDPEQLIESGYRFLLADLMPFGKNARIQLEHGGVDESKEHYRTVTYWYGLPAPSLVKTDSLKVGDSASEHEHRYLSPDASKPYQITSRYELGVDHLNGVEIFPAETDSGRKTTGTSEFVLKIDPANVGVMLRRKLDYGFANQRAIVSIADASGDATPVAAAAAWKPAGIWYLAGSNVSVNSNPKAELGATEHKVLTSNRRFRDDEFLLPKDLTAGRAAIRLRIVFTPVHIPLFPGHPEAELAWSEIRYDAYSYVMPAFSLDGK